MIIRLSFALVLPALGTSCASSTTAKSGDQHGVDAATAIDGGTTNDRTDGSSTAASGGTGGGVADAGRGTGGVESGGNAGLDPMNDSIVNDPACPTTNPTEETACPELGLVCKYGDDLNCRSRWACAQRCDPVCGSELAWVQNFAERDCPGVCPLTEPQLGEACSGFRTLCTYGDDPICRTEWECRDGSWVALVPPRDCARTDVYCPEQPPTSISCDLSEVTPPDARCVYEYGKVCTCACIWDLGGQGATGLQTHWSCFIPSGATDLLNPSCPLATPSAGTPCAGDAVCSYAAPDICEMPTTILTAARCVSGRWEVSP